MTSTYNRLRRAATVTSGVISLIAVASTMAFADLPSDLVPRGSGVYGALAVLAKGHLLPDGNDAATFVGAAARLRSRGEIASMVSTFRINGDESQLTSNEAAALEFLTAYLADPQVSDHTPKWRSAAGYAGSLTGEIGGRKIQGDDQKGFADGFGDLHVFGTNGSIYYAAGASNYYQQRANSVSFNTRAGGVTPDDDIRQRSGLEDAYVAWQGARGIQVNVGVKSRRWGPGYAGDLMFSDSAPARPGIELNVPIWLGHVLKLYRFTQIQETYKNLDKTVYVGMRRLEHPLDHHWDLDLQESYSATKFRSPAILFMPYYAYQKAFIANHQEPNEFNYQVNGGLTYKTGGDNDGNDVYLQFLIDDIQSPDSISLGNKVKRKVGYLVGLDQTFPASGTSVAAEYARTDPGTYSKTAAGREPLSWFVSDLPIGHPIGSNGQEVFGRLGQRLSSRLDLALTGTVRRRIDSSFPAPNDTLVTAALAYHVNANQSVGVRFADFREDPYNGAVVINSAPGGADYGVKVREKVVALDYQIGF